MKKIFTLLVIAVLIAGYASAQQSEGLFGVHAGLNLSSFWGSDVPESVKSKPGIKIGIETLLDFPRSKNLSYNIAMSFVQRGAKFESWGLYGTNVDAEIALNSLLFHVCPRYTFDLGNDMGIFLQAGLFGGLNVSAKVRAKEDGVWESEKLEIGSDDGQVEFLESGLVLGAGLQVKNNINVGVGYNLGIATLAHGENAPAIRNSSLSFTATYFFNKK